MTSIERALITFVAASLGLALAVSAVGTKSDDTPILATASEPIPVAGMLSLRTTDNPDLTMQLEQQIQSDR